MKHRYELRELKANERVETVLRINAEPKDAKQRAKRYANEHKGIYSLYKVEEVQMYFTEKE